MTMTFYAHYCAACGEMFPPARAILGYRVCLPCGEEIARERKFTVAPMHKSNYMLISDPEDLKGLNNKGGLYR